MRKKRNSFTMSQPTRSRRTTRPLSIAQLAREQINKRSADQAGASEKVMRILADAPPATGRAAPSAASIRDATVAYVLPEKATLDQKWAFFRYLNVAATNTDDTNPKRWSSWLLSLMALLYRHLIDSVDRSEVYIQELGQDEMDELTAWYEWCQGESPMQYTVAEANRVNLMKAVPGDIFPRGYTYIPHLIEQQHDILEMYAYLGIVLFAVSKDAGRQGERALKVARPEAALLKYRWTSTDVPSIATRLAPTAHAFQMINNSWVRLPSSRLVIFSYVCRIASLNAPATDEAVFLTVRLMKWSDHSHIALISEFLTKYPWATRISSLTSSVSAFNSAVSQMIQMCPPLRDDRGIIRKNSAGVAMIDKELMPYTKVLHGDKLDIGKRDTMSPLLWVAYNALLPDHPSLSQYTVEDRFDTVYTDFLRLRDEIYAEDQEEEEEEETVAEEEEQVALNF